jgi:D-tyrosyl-tRNA(Tyr) deacylase
VTVSQVDNGVHWMILIVASTKDIASLSIRNQLLACYNFEKSSENFHNNPVYHRANDNDVVKLVTIKEEAIYYQAITDHFNPQLIIYISLSVHTPGNLAEAQRGGLSRRISIAPSDAMKVALMEMSQQKDKLCLSYQVSYECTHHGPSLDTPTMFAELGSTLTQWKDMKAAEAIAHATMKSISRRSKRSIAAVGIGGPHYNKKFTQIALEGSFAFGHMIPKYAITQIDEEIIRQCVERTVEQVETIVLDWKGIRGADKPKLIKVLEEVGVGVQRI